MKSSLRTLLLVGIAGASSASAQLLFTQYYEGPSTNKWYEITNVGSTSIDLSDYTVSLYTNANTELWKGGTTATANFVLTGNLAAGATLLVGNTSNTTPFVPASAPAPYLSNNTTANFNGNDSLVLWNDSAAFSTAQIVDTLAFTATGGSGSGEGVDKSFVRISSSVGYSLSAGSSILSFPGVWSEVTLATVNAALANTDNYLGYSSISAVPEPSSFAALAGVGALGFCALRRRRSA